MFEFARLYLSSRGDVESLWNGQSIRTRLYCVPVERAIINKKNPRAKTLGFWIVIIANSATRSMNGSRRG
jgi:hypothetical protein